VLSGDSLSTLNKAVASGASHMTLGLLKLSSSDAKMVNRRGKTNFLGFLLFGCDDNDEDGRFLFVELGVLGDAMPDFGPFLIPL